MENFNYLEEAKKVELLTSHPSHYKDFMEERNALYQKSKFRLCDILEYLEIGLKKITNDKWAMNKLIYFNEETKRMTLYYYAINKRFDKHIRTLVKVGSEKEKTTNTNMKNLEDNNLMNVFGVVTVVLNDKYEIFDAIEEIEDKEDNYLENGFFGFSKELDGLYDIIIDHINRKNNGGYSYTKKAI